MKNSRYPPSLQGKILENQGGVMSTAHYVSEEAGGKKMEGEIETLAIQDLKKGVNPSQFLASPALQHDGNFDLVVKDAEGNLKHIVVSNTDQGIKQVHKLYKSGGMNKSIAILIGQRSYKLIGMDDGQA